MDSKDSIKFKYYWFLLFLLIVSIFFYFYLQQENSLFLKRDLSSGFSKPRLITNTTQEKTSETTIVLEPEVKTLDFLFFGDIMLDRNVGAKIAKDGLDPLLANLAGENKSFFSGYDLVSANLEGAVTTAGEHYAPVAGNDFAFSPEVVSALQNYNFNFFNLANNHLTDQGQKGLQETKDNLTALGLNFSGCPDAQIGECSAKIVEIDNTKVAMLGFSMVYNPVDLKELKKIISDFKEQADLVVVNVHWGVEYEHKYNTTQAQIAHDIIDSGADLIIGHHPHVVQGLEIYNNKPIFYSLGNFIFDQYFSSATQEGLALGFSIDPQTKKFAINLFPLQAKNSQVQLMPDEAKEKFLTDFITWSKLNPEQEQSILKAKINL